MPKQDKKVKKLYEDQLERFGANVAELRKKAGLTQLQLAFATKLTLSYISKIESGKMNPSLIWVISLAKALNVSVTEILKDLE
ncbi:MAG: helix-turn-helix transcriptional regulator [Patescibacteria group bacterium]